MTLSLPPEPVPLPPEQVPADSPLSGLATIAPEHDPSAARVTVGNGVQQYPGLEGAFARKPELPAPL